MSKTPNVAHDYPACNTVRMANPYLEARPLVQVVVKEVVPTEHFVSGYEGVLP